MKKIYTILAAILVISGCATKIRPLTTYGSSFAVPVTMAEMKEGIFIGASEKGWNVKEVNANTIEARINLRKHEVVVAIKYNTKGYDIEYKSSKNMLYNSDDNMIHRNYIRWTKNLDDHIRGAVYKVIANK